MRVVFMPLAALGLIGAGEPEFDPPAPLSLGSPAYSTPPERWNTVEDALEEGSDLAEMYANSREESCNDRITLARQASGQLPLLNREPASPDKPLAIYAVDREQDGCSVMVMMGDPNDIRPLPELQEGPLLQQIPARAGQ